MELFWDSHSPTYQSWSRQYMSAIFYHNETQRQLAQESKAREEAKLGMKLYTDIAAYREFYAAEDYHQKYALQNQQEFAREFRAIYPNITNFMNSTAAARVNGYLSGYGAVETVQDEIGRLGLSPELQKKLLKRLRM